MHKGALEEFSGALCMHRDALNDFGLGLCMHRHDVFFAAAGWREIGAGKMNRPTLPGAVWVRCKDWVIRAVMVVNAWYMSGGVIGKRF